MPPNPPIKEMTVLQSGSLGEGHVDVASVKKPSEIRSSHNQETITNGTSSDSNSIPSTDKNGELDPSPAATSNDDDTPVKSPNCEPLVAKFDHSVIKSEIVDSLGAVTVKEEIRGFSENEGNPDFSVDDGILQSLKQDVEESEPSVPLSDNVSPLDGSGNVCDTVDTKSLRQFGKNESINAKIASEQVSKREPMAQSPRTSSNNISSKEMRSDVVACTDSSDKLMCSDRKLVNKSNEEENDKTAKVESDGDQKLGNDRVGKRSAEDLKEPIAKKTRFDKDRAGKAEDANASLSDTEYKVKSGAIIEKKLPSTESIVKVDGDASTKAKDQAIVPEKRMNNGNDSVSFSDEPVAKKPRSDNEAALVAEEQKKVELARSEPVTSLVDTDDEDADDPSLLHSDSGEEDILHIDEGPTESETATSEVVQSHPKPAPARSVIEASDVEDSVQSSASGERGEVESTSVGTQMPSLNVLRRGSIAKITKSDLEELMVQKFCEIVTERSNVGELRRRIQALEFEAEKWKERALASTKQMKELELVMKKFKADSMSQLRDKPGIIAPVRVTRSVGLQVAIGAANKKVNTKVKKKPVHQCPPIPKSTPMAVSSPSSASKSKPVSTPRSTPTSTTRPASVPRFTPTPPTKSAPTTPNKPKAIAPATAQLPPPGSGPTPNSAKPPKPKVVKCAPKPKKGPPLAKKSTTTVAPIIDIDLTDDDDGSDSSAGTSNTSTSTVSQSLQPLPPKVVLAKPDKKTVLISNPMPKKPEKITYVKQSDNTYLVKGTEGEKIVLKAGAQPAALTFQGRNMSPQQGVMVPLRVHGGLTHPAPLPKVPVDQPRNSAWKFPPPRPILKISTSLSGIVLSWEMSLTTSHEPIASYQIMGYQEGNNPPRPGLWKEVGDVQALPLPMACTLTHFVQGHKYHFAVRAVDIRSRVGPYSAPGTIFLVS